MLTVSLADFTANPQKYAGAPAFSMDIGGTRWIVRPERRGFFARLFGKGRGEGSDVPSGKLRAALRECRKMEKHPEKYKTYASHEELLADIGIQL